MGELLLGPYPEGEAARLVSALGPESGEGVPRTRVDVEARLGGQLLLRFEAPSTSGFRAAVNAHLRWVELARRVDRLALPGGTRARADAP